MISNQKEEEARVSLRMQMPQEKEFDLSKLYSHQHIPIRLAVSTGCRGGWKFLKWTRYINGTCGSGKGSPPQLQISYHN
jgi:hypothetical protein